MANVNSYYLYQKYEKRGDQPWIPLDIYSIDGDGTELPVLRMKNDPNCYVDEMYRWVKTNDVICIDDTQIEYRTVSGDPYCIGISKYVDVTEEISYDAGVSWEMISSGPILVERYSFDCGGYGSIYLSFIALEDGTFRYTEQSNNYDKLYYSLNSGTTWTSLDKDTDTPTITSGSTIMWKCSRPSEHNYGTFAPTFSSSGYFNVQGNILSLSKSDDYGETDSINWYFAYLFENCKVVDASKLAIREGTITRGLFKGCASLTDAPTELPVCVGEEMFYGCTSLTTAPTLPATTTLSDAYYRKMFFGCTSLTVAPTLLATTVGGACYYEMFKGCTSLTTAPTICASTVGYDCCRGMFANCTALTTAPSVLPATTLGNSCYNNMFSGCTSLTNAPQLPATTLAEYCYNGMFYGCTSLTVAPTLPATTLADGCYYDMFNHCTSLTTAPSELPATALTEYCYGYMFYYCTSLTTAPQLPAATLNRYSYQYMFGSCYALTSITCLATDISAYYCTNSWVSNVGYGGTFTKASSMSSWSRDSNGIPSSWIVDNYTN